VERYGMTAYAEVYTLHRYFIWANMMRTQFDERLRQSKGRDDADGGIKIEQFAYMSYWYAGLYVLIEGWREMSLTDENIDALLISPNVELLRRYRNGVCHFQADYFDQRFTGFMGAGRQVVDWVRSLNREFGRYFLELAAQETKE